LTFSNIKHNELNVIFQHVSLKYRNFVQLGLLYLNTTLPCDYVIRLNKYWRIPDKMLNISFVNKTAISNLLTYYT